jgi:hypothetical protein
MSSKTETRGKDAKEVVAIQILRRCSARILTNSLRTLTGTSSLSIICLNTQRAHHAVFTTKMDESEVWRAFICKELRQA